MNQDTYITQIKRLKEVFGEKYYSPLRAGLMWEAFKHVQDAIFTRAVDLSIKTLRSAPLLPELQKLIEVVVGEDKQRAREYSLNQIQSPLDVMQNAARENQTADPEFVKMCIKLLEDKNSGKINMKQFLEGCDFLDEAAKKLRGG